MEHILMAAIQGKNRPILGLILTTLVHLHRLFYDEYLNVNDELMGTVKKEIATP
jgi:hypothetical protein